ncbi:MAG: hypothetical protein JXJ20_09755 [Anaerolineae bacterium]|jgi:hypothetical protein|nr:hypothetical protein [Anaerolineae bacterium]
MQRDMMLLVSHAEDGHFADGDRDGVRRVLSGSEYIGDLKLVARERYEIVCTDGAALELYAPGLHKKRPFHRIELFLDLQARTVAALNLILELMREGEFGLMDGLDAARFIVSSPQQLDYFPHLCGPPLLARNTRDLYLWLGYPPA